MKTLGLFRHAKSDWPELDQGGPRARDFDRPLNLRGEKGAALMGRHVRDHGQRWDHVVASPAIRVAQTIEIAAKAAGRSFNVNWDRRIYLASSATLIDLLRDQSDDYASVMLVGHNPGLEDVIFDLVPDDGTSPLRDSVEEKFPTATFAVLEIAIERWSELRDNCARLVHLTRPRDLDPALGPALV